MKAALTLVGVLLLVASTGPVVADGMIDGKRKPGTTVVNPPPTPPPQPYDCNGRYRLKAACKADVRCHWVPAYWRDDGTPVAASCRRYAE